MKKFNLTAIIVGLFTLLPITIFAGTAKPSQLKLASDVWPPFTDVAGKPRQALDLAQAALERSQVNNRIRITAWNEVLAGLKKATIDGCAAIWHTPEREQYLLFSKPYLENRLVLVGRAGTIANKTGLSDLKGKRVALIRGYAYGAILEETKDVVVVFGDNDTANLKAVLAGKADYLLADELVMHRLFESYPEKARKLLAVGTNPVTTRALHFAIRRSYPGAEKIITSFNNSILNLITDGTYNQLLQVSWIRADIDEDGVEDFISTGISRSIEPKAGTGYHLFQTNKDATPPKHEPSFIINGKKYQSWNEASRMFHGTEYERAAEPPSKDEAGLVLFQF
jgi:polar amino acid transport system substrate-binding protein